jgi:hypothetical protein
MRDRQEQIAGDDATLYQAGRDVVVGPTVTEVIRIAELTLDSRMDRIRGSIGDIAEKRVFELLGKLRLQLSQAPTEVQERAKEPAFQFAVLDAAKAYASSGRSDLADRLTSLLVERTARVTDTLAEVALAQALKVVPILTPRMYDALGLTFVTRHVQAAVARSLDDYLEWYVANTATMRLSSPFSDAEWQHLAYAGCGTLENAFDFGGHVHAAYEMVRPLNRTLFVEKLLKLEPRLNGQVSGVGILNGHSLYLTTIGIVIGHDQWRRATGSITPLDIWLKEGG